ncbi:MAG: hypothetical protein QXU76_04020 [Candidatus Bilamarchaeaceae archaeon]
MEGSRKDVVEKFFADYKIQILPTTVDFYRRLGLLADCIVKEPQGKFAPRTKTVYDVEKTVLRLKRIMELREKRFYLEEIKEIIRHEIE